MRPGIDAPCIATWEAVTELPDRKCPICGTPPSGHHRRRGRLAEGILAIAAAQILGSCPPSSADEVTGFNAKIEAVLVAAYAAAFRAGAELARWMSRIREASDLSSLDEAIRSGHVLASLSIAEHLEAIANEARPEGHEKCPACDYIFNPKGETP